MIGTSGFQEVRSSASRSPSYQFLHEQQLQFGAGSGQFLYTHNHIAPFTGISTKREKVPEAVFMPAHNAIDPSTGVDIEREKTS